LDALTETRLDADLVLLMLNQHADFGLVLSNPVYQSWHKAMLIEKTFKASIGLLTYHFMQLVIANGRADCLHEILNRFVAIYNKKMGIVTGRLTTPTIPEVVQIKDIQDKIFGSYKTEVELDFVENPDLLGGFILQIEDKLFDASISGKLRRIKTMLISEN